MTRIVAVPGRIQELARALDLAAQVLAEMEARLARVSGGLDWEVRQRADLEAMVSQARREVRSLSSQAQSLGRFLSDRAIAFEQADQSGSDGVAGLAAISQSVQTALFSSSRGANSLYPAEAVAGYLRIGRLIDMKRAASRISDIFTLIDHANKVPGPVKVVIGSFIDIIGDRDLSGRGISVDVLKNILGFFLEKGNPAFGPIFLANAAIQLGGSLIIWQTTMQAKYLDRDGNHAALIDASNKRAMDALEKLNLDIFQSDAAALVYDLNVETRISSLQQAWTEPTVLNILKTNYLLPHPELALADSRVQAAVDQHLSSLGEHIRDFGKGLVLAPCEMTRHAFMGWLVGAHENSETLNKISERFLQQMGGSH